MYRPPSNSWLWNHPISQHENTCWEITNEVCTVNEAIISCTLVAKDIASGRGYPDFFYTLGGEIWALLTFKHTSPQPMHHWGACSTGYFILFKNQRIGYLEVIYKFHLLRTNKSAASPIAFMNLGAWSIHKIMIWRDFQESLGCKIKEQLIANHRDWNFFWSFQN